MAMNNKMVLMSDGGGSGKKTFTKPTGVQPNQTYNDRGYPVTVNNTPKETAATPPVTLTGQNVLADKLKGQINNITKTLISEVKADKAKQQSSGGGGGGSSTPASTPNYDTTVPSVFGDTQDPQLVAQYQAAMQALEKMKGEAPTYGSQYDTQIQDLYQQIMGRGPFKYDQKTDPLYQQYVQDYVTQGKMAMRDTMGRAAGLTGGYGSSYGQAVGQQQYDQYLQQLADILPETYNMALNAWALEGDQLNQKLATTTDLEKSDYNRYLDQLQQHNIDVDRAQNNADNWYDRMVAAEKQAYNRQLDQYEMQNDYYNRLVQLIATGYKPTKEEYNKAGLSQAQGEALRGAYMPQPQTVYVRTGGTPTNANNSTSGTNQTAAVNLTDEQGNKDYLNYLKNTASKSSKPSNMVPVAR